MAHSYTKKEGLGMRLLRSLEFPHMVNFAFIHSVTLVTCKFLGGESPVVWGGGKLSTLEGKLPLHPPLDETL